MAKTISDEKKRFAENLIDKVVTPKIEKLIDVFNESLKPHGIRVGLELNWLMDDTTDEKETKQ